MFVTDKGDNYVRDTVKGNSFINSQHRADNVVNIFTACTWQQLRHKLGCYEAIPFPLLPLICAFGHVALFFFFLFWSLRDGSFFKNTVVHEKMSPLKAAQGAGHITALVVICPGAYKRKTWSSTRHMVKQQGSNDRGFGFGSGRAMSSKHRVITFWYFLIYLESHFLKYIKHVIWDELFWK